MTLKQYTLFALLVILTAALAALMFQVLTTGSIFPSQVNDQDTTQGDEFIGDIENDVSLADLEAGALVTTSPLVFTGDADSSWFSSEGTFAVELQDMSGNVLGIGTALAQGSLNAGERLPFIATIPFELSADVIEGIMIMQKDNPTGFPEEGAEIGISVRFVEESTVEEGA